MSVDQGNSSELQPLRDGRTEIVDPLDRQHHISLLSLEFSRLMLMDFWLEVVTPGYHYVLHKVVPVIPVA
ncbi:hypothetical protein TNCV_2483341 [Trichonephila clavipes]|uniref:Uncharacterized protein n=1 Tax=Trichonephila clavipes TaxID=2585209 RepID=A0A8X6VZ87_TRICX|nr:hypothetical protein TNCV_2483341 [Trichonephila clavipes]